MLISNVNRFGCQKIRHIFNVIGCHYFGTYSAGKLNSSNLLIDSLNCKYIHRIPAHYQQFRYFHQTAPTLSSQSLSKSETEEKDEKQLHQPSEGKENKQDEKQINAYQPQLLVKIYKSIGRNHNLNIQGVQGSSGQKYFEIYIAKFPGPMFYKLPKIHVPQDAYKFIKAIDRLFGQLPAQKPEENSTEGDESPSQPVLATQTVEGGLYYDFKLSVVWHPETGQWDLEIHSVKTVQEHKERWLRIPLWAWPWLRQQMTSVLVKHDGSEQINEPRAMPEWAKQARNLRTSSKLPKLTSQPKSSPKNPAAQNLSAQVQQQQQLAQLQAQIAQLTSAITMNVGHHQTPSFNPDGFMANQTAQLNPSFTSAYPNPALQSTTADASTLVAQLIDQLNMANGIASAAQSKQQTPPKNRKRD